MTNYFVLECPSPLGKMQYTLQVGSPANGTTWRNGILLAPAARWANERPPPEPIEIRTKPERSDQERFVYPELTWVPVPLMTRRLVAALRESGVDNLQTFETVLREPLGNAPPPPHHYLAVNVVGAVTAADLKKSQLNPDVSDRVISADFHSLAIDETRTHNFLMFRLAENTSAVLVHRRVREAVEARGINTLRWYDPEKWAG
jgi:hypothetical protein